MGDYGLKIAKAGSNVDSTDPNDYNFWSKYQSLPLIYKVTEQIDVTTLDGDGTHTYTHSLGFFPLVLGYVLTATSDRQAIPFAVTGENRFYCDFDTMSEDFSMKIKDNTVDIIYEVGCIQPMVGVSPPYSDKTYDIELYFYMFELGQ